MNFELIAQIFLIIINATGLILVKWIVESSSSKNLKKWFVVMTASILLWANFSYLGSRSEDIDLSILFYKLNWAAVSIFLPSFYYFYINFFIDKGKNAQLIGKLIIAFSFVFLNISLFTNWIIESVVSRDWGMEIVLGEASDAFNIFSLIVALIVIFYSISEYKDLIPERKRQLRFFLAGLFIFIFANIIFNVASQIIFNSVQYQILGDFSSIFLLGFTAYASIQQRLFQVKVIVTEAASAFLLVFLFARIFNAQDITLLIIDGFVFLVALLFSFILVKSVNREVEQRERLQVLTEKLKKLDARKDEFLSVAAHELRAPMTAIKGYLSMIQNDSKGKLSEDTNIFLGEAAEQNERLIRLVNNLLNVSRIEEGRMVFDMGEMYLEEIVNTVFKQFKQSAIEKNLKYELFMQEDIHDNIYVDKDRIYEVISNLISNAIKYTDSGEIEVRLLNPSKGKIRFEVKDTGDGLSQVEQAKLFQKFYRAESNIGKKIGTGLGLYIVKLLINKFGGTIGVKSQKDEGSTFWFELPLYYNNKHD